MTSGRPFTEGDEIMREYEITTGTGIPLTVLLDEETAKRRGLKPLDRNAAPKTSAKTPANKARKARDKTRGVADSSDD